MVVNTHAFIVDHIVNCFCSLLGFNLLLFSSFFPSVKIRIFSPWLALVGCQCVCWSNGGVVFGF